MTTQQSTSGPQSADNQSADNQSADQTSTIRPFRVEIPQADLDDLRDRVARTRLAAPAPGDSWDYGTTEAYLSDMVAHWRDSFDWRTEEARMNEFPHFLTEIEGQTVHFLHVRSAEPTAAPLVLTHSYPGSFVDFLDMIGPLTDPVAHGGRAEDAFHVVIPSIPGFGFSTPLVEGGWTMKRVARAWDVLMRRLGYDSYGAHGSDTGANVSRELAILNPDGFLGAHVLQLFSFPSGDPAEFASLTPKDHQALEFLGWFQQRAGFAAANGSRPQTVGAGLADSPVAQLAWSELFENFGNGTSLMTRDQVLTQVSLYWLTNTGATASRFYYEEARAGQEPVVNEGRIGVAVFADDFLTIRPFAERDNTNLVHWSEFETGGHFAAMEVPDQVAGDLRTFFGDRG
ncbi:epoxide hydrolase family protein [Nocardioides sp.]|uniref:epoxide hydrolase family protein n=1 Tax=Nocardioides sp. TaxID=35761 RepID=UPI002734229A|nr:epoxide hydrolase family protein [Nocardioides sp.]MDP3894851.1 epoxide hydrolase [Nocardioides sp.]